MGGANHFKGFPEIPVEKVRFAEDGKMVTRPGNNSLYSNDMYTDKMLGFLKFYRWKAILWLSSFPSCSLTVSVAPGYIKKVRRDIPSGMG